MGLRVRRSVKLFPGVRVNFSKSGISTSIGVKGATLNVKPGRKSRVTVGIPGTGLSYSTQLDDANTHAGAPASDSDAGASGARIIRSVGWCIVAIGGMFIAVDSNALAWMTLAAGAAIVFASRTKR